MFIKHVLVLKDGKNMEISSQKYKLNNTIIKSIIWNNIIDLFKREKNIDLTPYLISITLKQKTIFVKTNKPIISTELLNIDDKIKNIITIKLKKLWINFYDFNIKYI